MQYIFFVIAVTLLLVVGGILGLVYIGKIVRVKSDLYLRRTWLQQWFSLYRLAFLAITSIMPWITTVIQVILNTNRTSIPWLTFSKARLVPDMSYDYYHPCDLSTRPNAVDGMMQWVTGIEHCTLWPTIDFLTVVHVLDPGHHAGR